MTPANTTASYGNMNIVQPHQFNPEHIAHIDSIDPYAASILNSACFSYKKIIASATQAKNARKPFIVIAGEDHIEAPQLMQHMLIIEALAKVKENFAVALEVPHNIASVNASLEQQLDFLENVSRVPHCDYTNKLIYKQLKKHLSDKSATPIFTDCARHIDGYNHYISCDDKSTVKSITACTLPQEKYTPTSQEGLKVRDHHMAHKIISHIRETPQAFVYKTVGQLHLPGLCRHFEQAHIPHIALAHWETHSEVNDYTENTVILESLPSHVAHYDPTYPSNILNPEADSLTTEEEQRYTNTMLKTMGYAHLIR